MAFNATDLTILQQLQRGNNWLRAVLCTLARRGVAFRLAYPVHAQYILDSVTVLPYYKGGQFLFDLMEWEDFMLDGSPAPLLSSIFNAPMSDQVKAVVSIVTKTISAQFSPSDAIGVMEEGEGFVLPDGELPPLESSFYLYQEVVLGLIASQLVRSLEPDREDSNNPRRFDLSLNPEATVIGPDEVGIVMVSLFNHTPLEYEIELTLTGFPLEWASFAETKFNLTPGAEKQIALTIQPPTDNPSLAHLYSYQVFVLAGGEKEPLARASGSLLIQSFVAVNHQKSVRSNGAENGSNKQPPQ